MTSRSAPLALVVDDDPVTRHLVRRALDDLGCRAVLEAQDGVEGQSLLQEHPDVDLVLTDILMPRLDGLELLRWGREQVPDAAWIILSGLDTFDSAVEAIRLGAFDFLAKPPRVAELEVAVRNALERRMLLVEKERLDQELRQSNEQLAAKVRELEETSERLRSDLERAEIIQRALLPSSPPSIEDFRVHALYRPGHHVGGDLYEVARIDGRHLALYVADATGHGVTAAMLSVVFKHHLVLQDEETGRPLSPAAVLRAVNRALEEAVAAPGLFLTAVYCLLDMRTGEVTVASAGHPPALHVRATGETDRIRRTGPALGLVADARFGEERFRLEPQDRLLLYSDGLSAAGATGSRHLSRLLRQHPDDGAEVLAELLRGAGAEDEAEERDDITLLLLEARPGPSGFDNGTAASRASPSTRTDSDVVRYGETGTASFLALRGRATWIHCAPFYDTAATMLDSGRALVLDLSECEYLDSTCLGTIHELVDRGGVRLQNVRPPVIELFAETGMDRVLGSIEEGTALPELYPLAGPPGDAETGRQRMLDAHEALSALSARNREAFAAVVEELRGRPDDG